MVPSVRRSNKAPQSMSSLDPVRALADDPLDRRPVAQAAADSQRVLDVGVEGVVRGHHRAMPPWARGGVGLLDPALGDQQDRAVHLAASMAARKPATPLPMTRTSVKRLGIRRTSNWVRYRRGVI